MRRTRTGKGSGGWVGSGVALIRGIAYTVGETADLAILMLAQHSQRITDRQRFAESAGRDIESLTGRSDA